MKKLQKESFNLGFNRLVSKYSFRLNSLRIKDICDDSKLSFILESLTWFSLLPAFTTWGLSASLAADAPSVWESSFGFLFTQWYGDDSASWSQSGITWRDGSNWVNLNPITNCVVLLDPAKYRCDVFSIFTSRCVKLLKKNKTDVILFPKAGFAFSAETFQLHCIP